MTIPQIAPERGNVTEAPATTVKATPPQPQVPPLVLPDGRRVRAIHLVAELAPFARSGGLGEAVASLARFQSASGVATSIIMPFYDRVRSAVNDIEQVGSAFTIQVGPRTETAKLWKHRPHGD